jgi:hypothetical protein
MPPLGKKCEFKKKKRTKKVLGALLEYKALSQTLVLSPQKDLPECRMSTLSWPYSKWKSVFIDGPQGVKYNTWECLEIFIANWQCHMLQKTTVVQQSTPKHSDLKWRLIVISHGYVGCLGSTGYFSREVNHLFAVRWQLKLELTAGSLSRISKMDFHLISDTSSGKVGTARGWASVHTQPLHVASLDNSA